MTSASGREALRPRVRRNDAVAAVFFASGLHAQREGRPTGDAGLERRAARAIAVPESRRRRYRQRAPSTREQIVLAMVRNEMRDVRQVAQIVRAPRRVAAGHDDLHVRVAARDASDGLTCPLIGARPSPSRC